MPDVSKLRVGDVVHVRGVVSDQSGDKYIGVEFKHEDRRRYVDIVDIVHVEPRPLKVGDRVRDGTELGGEIRAIEDGRAWVKWDGDFYGTLHLQYLERAE